MQERDRESVSGAVAHVAAVDAPGKVVVRDLIQAGMREVGGPDRRLCPIAPWSPTVVGFVSAKGVLVVVYAPVVTTNPGAQVAAHASCRHGKARVFVVDDGFGVGGFLFGDHADVGIGHDSGFRPPSSS